MNNIIKKQYKLLMIIIVISISVSVFLFSYFSLKNLFIREINTIEKAEKYWENNEVDFNALVNIILEYPGIDVIQKVDDNMIDGNDVIYINQYKIKQGNLKKEDYLITDRYSEGEIISFINKIDPFMKKLNITSIINHNNVIKIIPIPNGDRLLPLNVFRINYIKEGKKNYYTEKYILKSKKINELWYVSEEY